MGTIYFMINNFNDILAFWLVSIIFHMFLLPQSYPDILEVSDSIRLFFYGATCITYTYGYIRGANVDIKCKFCGKNKKGIY